VIAAKDMDGSYLRDAQAAARPALTHHTVRTLGGRLRLRANCVT
jgi:hypothetical protein